jgi:5'(3')-deoxyribonucleotidase
MPNLENKPKIAVDIDEVLFPMVSDLIEYVDKQHSVKLTPEQFIKYNLEDIWHGGPLEGAVVFDAYKDQSGIEVAPVEGAVEALGVLSVKYDVIVMTSRDIEVEEKTKNWLNYQFPEIFKEVHLLGNSRDSITWRTKDEVSQELGVSYLIDDHLYHVLRTSKLGIKSLLFGDYPWNQTDELPEGVRRVKNWQEVLEYFDAEAR